MPLALLAPLVVAGVAIVILAVHFSGGSRTKRFDGRSSVLAAFGDFLRSQGMPEHDPQWLAIAEDGVTAFVETRDRELALLRAHGKQPTVRIISAGEIRFVDQSKDKFTVTFKLRDWTWPKIVASFDDRGVASYATELLERRAQAA